MAGVFDLCQENRPCDTSREGSAEGLAGGESFVVGHLIGHDGLNDQVCAGRFAVFFPGEPFKSGVAMGESSLVKKVLFKVEE